MRDIIDRVQLGSVLPATADLERTGVAEHGPRVGRPGPNGERQLWRVASCPVLHLYPRRTRPRPRNFLIRCRRKRGGSGGARGTKRAQSETSTQSPDPGAII